MSERLRRHKAWDNATTQRTKPDTEAPVTILDLVALFARGLDESHAATRMHR
jgi:hypothetical protein